MNNPIVSNPNDFKVVEFHNSTDFDFTPEMGCMYDSRPIFGISGRPGIAAGERMSLPYHIGHRLAMNLAKQTMIKRAPAIDPKDNPTGSVLWNDDSIKALKDTFITELYTEDKPIGMSETDVLMKKVEELKKFVQENIPAKPSFAETPTDTSESVTKTTQEGSIYKDKAEVIAELTKRGIQFNARDSKATLEKLLA